MKKILLTAVLCSVTAVAGAAPVQFVTTGVGSGRIGSTVFGNEQFTITSLGDTSFRVSQATAGANIFFIDHVSSSIVINNVGTFQLLSGTRTFVNPGQSIVGYSRAGSMGSDLYNGPTDPAFITWDMLSSIGPILGTANLLQWMESGAQPPVQTNAGALVFNTASSPATFTATVVPEPSTICLAAFAAIALAWYRRRLTKPDAA